MKRLILATGLTWLALAALCVSNVRAQNFGPSTPLMTDGTFAVPYATPMETYRPFFGKGYVVHVPLSSSWRLPNGDNLDVGPDGAVYRNALRLNTRTTSSTGTVTVTKNVCAEIMVVGNELYCRAKTDATKVYRWNQALTRWEAAPADAYAPLLAPAPNPSLPSTTSAEPRSFVSFPSIPPAPAPAPSSAIPTFTGEGVITGVSAACVASGFAVAGTARVIVWFDSNGYEEATVSDAGAVKAWSIAVPASLRDGNQHRMMVATATPQGGSTNFGATTFTCP